MKAQTHLRVCAYLLTLLGLWSVTMTEYFSSIWPIAATAMVAAGWFYEGPQEHRRAYRRVWMALSICMLLFFPFDVALVGSLLLPAVHLSMFAQAHLLFSPKTIGAYRRMFVVSFAQLLASTNLTSDVVFAAVLTVYCITAVYGVLLMYLQRDLQTSDDAGASPLDGQGVPQGLCASAIVSATVLLPLTLAFFYSAPRLQYALVARGSTVDALNRMNRARQQTGFTKTVQLGTFGRIQEDNTLALRVEIPADSAAMKQPLRWRGGALNIYDGMTWSSSRDFFSYYNGKKWSTGGKNVGLIYPQKTDLFIMDERYTDYESAEQLDADPRLLKQVFYLEVPFSESIFGAGNIKAIEGPFTYGIGQDFNRSFYINNRQALPELISYTVYSMVYEPDEAELRQVRPEEFEELIENKEYGSYVKTHYLQVPTSLNPRIRELALDITRNADTPYDKVEAIKDYLETRFTYSLDLGKPITDDPLYDFIFVSRSGHCEYFATAMAMMTRIVGIPARVAKGFQAGEWNDAGGFYEVRQRDAHAWVEVYFPGQGWVAFDPSPRAVADEYFEGQRSFIARALSKRLLLLQIQWRKYIVGYNEVRRLRLFAELRDLTFRDAPKAVAGLLGKLAGTVWSLTTVQWLMLMIIAAILSAAVLAYRKNILFPAFSWTMRRSKPGVYGAAFYERMLNLLEKRKIVKPSDLTPLEFLGFPALREHPMVTDIETLTSMYYRVRFGGETLAENETANVNDILKRLKQSNGRIHRREPATERF
jgi:transglutaminase-like putative cysteine protease